MKRKNFKKIIPIGKRDYCYQEEPVNTVLVLRGRIPRRGGTKPYLNDEQHRISSYELRIENHTQNSLTVTLSKYRDDIVEQRKIAGRAIIKENYQFGISFAELVNKIFEGQDVLDYETEEHFPESVKTAMRIAYDK